MLTATIDGITTRYDVVGSGPPLLMFSPGGFDATLDKWSTLGVYPKTRRLDHLSKTYSCIIFDRREAGQSGGRVERLTWAQYVAQGKGLLDHLNILQADRRRPGPLALRSGHRTGSRAGGSAAPRYPRARRARA